MSNVLNLQETIKTTGGVSGPAVALYCLMAVITLFSPELEEDYLPLSGIVVSLALVSIILRQRMGGGFFSGIFGVIAGLAVMGWQQMPTPLFPTELQNGAVFFEGVVLDRRDRHDSIQLILDRGVVPSGQDNILEAIQIPGRVQITVYQKQTLLAIPGDRVRIFARLKSIKSLRNPGGFDYARFQRQQGILISGYSKKPVLIIEPALERGWNRYRQTISQWIINVLPREEQGLAEALMVGKRGLLDGMQKEQLIVSGTIHLVAISGMHLGIVAGWSFFLLRFLLVLGMPFSRHFDVKKPAAMLAVFPTLVYAFLAGWSVPTQRATTMVCLLLFAVAAGRFHQTWRVLSMAAIVVLLYQPMQLFSAGFQLSFLSVVGLLYFLPLFRQGKGWRKKMLGILLVSLVTMVVIFPVITYHFHRVTPYGLLANLLAVPWVSFVSVPLGLLALWAHEIYPALGDLLLQGMGYSLEMFRLGIAWISTLPGAWQRLPGPALLGMALSLGCWALAGLLGMAGMTRWRIVLFVAAFPAFFWPRSIPPVEQLHLAVLDVGQAQSVVLYIPNGGWSVVDAGGWSSSRYNVGEAVISAYLWHYGVQHLNRVIISHPQRDHMAGAERLLRNFKVDSLWLGEFPEEERENSKYKRIIARAEQEGVQIRWISHGLQIEEGDATVTVFPSLPREQTTNDNDRSMAVEVAFAGQRFFMPGDATARTEKWLLDQHVIQPLTVLLAPHHGSKNSSTPAFVQASHPQHIVFSVGYRNSYRHPHPQVVQRWSAMGTHIWRTDQHGAIVFSSDGKNLQVKVAVKPDD